MHNCIFTAHCTELFCDRSCPILAETSYLLERNRIDMDSSVFKESKSHIDSALVVLSKSSGKVGAYVAKDSFNTVQAADLITYCAICQNWSGSRLHCDVYNLRYSKYLEELKKSWSGRVESDELEYMRIWSESSKVLVISNFDYINFGDFESQTLLNIIQNRQDGKKTTIFVTPPISTLVSNKSSAFFSSLKARLVDAVKVVSE